MTEAKLGRRVAVVLFNLGGPDGQAAVKPFLFNLFNDPAIIGLPGIVRTPLAKLIAPPMLVAELMDLAGVKMPINAQPASLTATYLPPFFWSSALRMA